MNSVHTQRWNGWTLLAEVIGRLRLLVALLLYAVVLFPAAGRLDWDRGWLMIAVFAAVILVNAPIVAWRNPEVLRERLKTHHGTKPFDRFFALAYLVVTIVFLAVAGLDAGRFGWSSVPDWSAPAGILLVALSDIPVLWAMLTNRHLETTVRIQSDRGHGVVTTGPYRFVRHPMYVGMVIQQIGAPLILGSLWSYVPAAVMIALLIWRTAREDETLRRELEGYEEYARTTRYRLVPGVW